MIRLATERLAPYAGRARALQSDGKMRFHLSDNTVDLEYRKVVIAFGVPSEVLIAGVKDSAQVTAAVGRQD